MITYRNDPLFLDKKFKYFIKSGRNKIPNLYRALLRPEDFKDKNIMLRTPYLIGHKLDKNINYYLSKLKNNGEDLGNVLRILEGYCEFKFSNFYKTKYRYKQILKTKRYNIILCRALSLALAKRLKRNDINTFSELLGNSVGISDDKNRTVIKFPLTKGGLLSLVNFYLSGVIIGDGHLSYKNHIWIVDGTTKTKLLKYSRKFINDIKYTFYKNFKVRSRIHERGNMVSIQISSKCLVRFFNYFFDIPIGKKCFSVKKPKILKLNPQKEGIFWRGLFDTDGFIDKDKKAIKLVTSSIDILVEFKKFCKKHKIPYFTNHRKRGYDISVLSFGMKKFAINIGISHPRKRKYLIRHLKKGPYYKVFRGVIKNKLTKNGYYDFSKIDNVNSSNLPKSPSSGVLRTIKLLRPYRNYTYIRFDEQLKNIDDKKVKSHLKNVEDMFNCKVVMHKRNRKHNQFCVISKNTSDFIKCFHKYELPWKPLNDREIRNIENKWKLSIFNNKFI